MTEIELTDLKVLVMSEQTKYKIVMPSIKSKLYKMEIQLKQGCKGEQHVSKSNRKLEYEQYESQSRTESMKELVLQLD